MTRILVLGGTTEARELAQRLAVRPDCTLTISLAGRTQKPVPYPAPVRSGGFGGAEGLAKYLHANAVQCLIDATHPYAAKISAHAARGARCAQVELVSLRRPPWQAAAGDRWIPAADVEGARMLLGSAPRRVFVALGRQQLGPLVNSPQHFYLVRSVEPIEPPLPVPRASYVLARGPFDQAEEERLLRQHAIDVVITKNSGGSATYGKIAAARALGLPVIVLDRPPVGPGRAFTSVADLLDYVEHWLLERSARGV